VRHKHRANEHHEEVYDSLANVRVHWWHNALNNRYEWAKHMKKVS